MSSDLSQNVSTFFPSFSTTAVIFFVFISTSLLGLFLAHGKKRGGLDMPGPWSLPFIGCMYLFRWSTFPPKTLANLAGIYGKVYCLNLGGTNVVVVNSFEAVKEVLYHRGTDFAGRPALFSFGLWGTTEESFMFKDYSLDFSNLKFKAEISMQELLNEGDFLSTKSLKAVEYLNSRFEDFALRENAFDPEESIKNAIADFIMDVIFGQSISRWFYHEARIVLEKASSAYAQTAYVGACVDFIHLMRYLTRKTLTKTTFQVGQLRAFVRKVYQIHQSSLLQEQDLKTSLAFCLRTGDRGYRTTASSCENSANSMILDDDMIVFLLTDIMFCAYEKLSSSLRWCIARLAASKQLQRDIHEKLHEDFCNERERRTGKFSLLAATVYETLRTSSILPFGIPRKTIRDTTLQGYKIPKDTLTFLNLWSCCYDPKCFPNPHEFDPYRYVSSDGENTSVKLPMFCSFSGGDRKCLGDNISKKFLTTLTAGILRAFELELVTPSPNISLEGHYAQTVHPKTYTICVMKRRQIAN